MTSEKLVYSGTVEALFLRALENRLTPACRMRLREAGLDLDQKLSPTYTLEQWKQFLRIAGDHIYAGMPTEAAYYSLGERFMDGYFSTLFGRALLGMARLLGPRRALTQARLCFRTSANCSEVRIVERGPTELEFWLTDIGADQPTFVAGVLARAAEVAGGQRVVVIPEGFDGKSATYHVSWSEQAEASVEPGLAARGTAAGQASATRPPA
ncbi:TIGR02265 family protein [Archangium sp.]|uniref:TIGR02265 family protein n=1 Tax=Archangium sp. TaxID=1872627 RepID=UPI002D3238C3|nr:TIGR02265 family protein [Archangium sp.]HYO52629.1 TIGR02265 family protein [Archangium sp.]